jgi:pimeloyl-ACP methyl ester carboxylesterase
MDIALVHGGYHGGWCWDLLRPELEALGHHVITMDLPISDPGLGAAAYAKTIADSLPAGSEPMLVAHSVMGLAAPLVDEYHPLKMLVFLAALMPVPGQSAAEQRATEPIDAPTTIANPEWIDHGQNVWMVGPNTARELFFHDVPADTADWAIALLRPQCYDMMSEVTPLQAWPNVPSRVIFCADDRATNPTWVRTAAHERLKVEAIGIAGGHSPFLSRPAELAGIIHSLA